MGEYSLGEAGLDGTGLRIGIAVSRFNRTVTRALLDGARQTLAGAGVADGDVTVVWVPGAFELPLVAARLAASHDAVVALGAVIRGETPHFDYVAGECARGLAQVALRTGVPVIFGVLTTDTLDQAWARAGGAEGHKGREAAAGAIEMARLLRRLDAGSAPGARGG
jgi:6,7-dimethyl-8-ribityllumazine synthase